MRRLIVTRGLPTLLLLMAIAVLLILSGAGSFGLALGLVVAGIAGVLLVSTVLYEVAHSEDRYLPREGHLYQGPQARGF